MTASGPFSVSALFQKRAIDITALVQHHVAARYLVGPVISTVTVKSKYFSKLGTP